MSLRRKSDTFCVMRCIACITLLCSVQLFAQNRNGGDATARGTCNIAISGTGNTVTVKTYGQDQTDELQKLLKSIAANQQVDTATILKKLDEFLKTMADRHLTDAQKALILAAMRPFKGKRVTVIAWEGDQDAYQYAKEFVEIFREAQLTFVAFAGDAARTGINTMTRIGGEPPVGLILQPVDAAEWQTPLFRTFDAVLNAAGIKHSAQYIGKFREGETDLEFFIAQKAK